MIRTEQEYQPALQRITLFQRRVDHLRKVEKNPQNYRLSASSYLSELGKLQQDAQLHFVHEIGN